MAAARVGGEDHLGRALRACVRSLCHLLRRRPAHGHPGCGQGWRKLREQRDHRPCHSCHSECATLRRMAIRRSCHLSPGWRLLPRDICRPGNLPPCLVDVHCRKYLADHNLFRAGSYQRLFPRARTRGTPAASAAPLRPPGAVATSTALSGQYKWAVQVGSTGAADGDCAGVRWPAWHSSPSAPAETGAPAVARAVMRSIVLITCDLRPLTTRSPTEPLWKMEVGVSHLPAGQSSACSALPAASRGIRG